MSLCSVAEVDELHRGQDDTSHNLQEIQRTQTVENPCRERSELVGTQMPVYAAHIKQKMGRGEGTHPEIVVSPAAEYIS